MTTPLPIIAAFLIAMLCGCGPADGPSDEEMRGCTSHRTPTWGDLIDCKSGRERAARDEEMVK